MQTRRPVRSLAAALILAAIAAATTGPAAAQSDPVRPQVQPPLVVPPSADAAAPASLVPAGLGSLVSLASAGQALTLDFAQSGEPLSPPLKPASPRGTVGWVIDSVTYWADYAFNAVTSGLTPPSPETFAKSTRSKDPNDFWTLVGDAGYKLKEISTDVGVVPDVGFRFKYVRELSDGDVNWLERKLERHGKKFKDPLSVIQRTIIYTLLSINSSDVYYVDELKVKLLPLPKAEFSLMPWDSGLSEEHDTLLRAIQGKKRIKKKPMEEDSHY